MVAATGTGEVRATGNARSARADPSKGTRIRVNMIGSLLFNCSYSEGAVMSIYCLDRLY